MGTTGKKILSNAKKVKKEKFRKRRILFVHSNKLLFHKYIVKRYV